jgi:hypothetical protein
MRQHCNARYLRADRHPSYTRSRSAQPCAILRSMEATHQGTDLPTTEALEVAARVRAAIAYSAQRVPEVAEKADIGVATLRRIISSTAPRGADAAELWRIADACNVPREWVATAWLAEGVEPAAAEDPEPAKPPHGFGRGTVEQRLDVAEHYLAVLLRLEARRTSDQLPLPPGSPQQRPRSDRATRRDRPQLPQEAGSGRASSRRS